MLLFLVNNKKKTDLFIYFAIYLVSHSSRKKDEFNPLYGRYLQEKFVLPAIFACDVFSFVVFKLIRSIFKSPSGILVRVQQDFIENTLHLWRPCNMTFKTHLVDLLLMVEIN